MNWSGGNTDYAYYDTRFTPDLARRLLSSKCDTIRNFIAYVIFTSKAACNCMRKYEPQIDSKLFNYSYR